MHLITPSGGALRFQGKTVGTPDMPLKAFRRQVQMVFQDSYASLNPRLTIEESIAFAPTVHGVPTDEAVRRARRLLDRVGLDPAALCRPLSARTVRRATPARQYRACAGARTKRADPGRGRVCSRQERRGAGAEPAARSQGRVRSHLSVHQSRPRGGPVHVVARARDVSRQGRRDRPDRGVVWRECASRIRPHCSARCCPWTRTNGAPRPRSPAIRRTRSIRRRVAGFTRGASMPARSARRASPGCRRCPRAISPPAIWSDPTSGHKHSAKSVMVEPTA